MARIRFGGSEIIATPIRQIDDTTWEMRAEQHGARVVPGTVMHVKQHEIVEMASAEAPSPPASTQAAIEVAMAKERETLPDPAQVLRDINAAAAAKRKADDPF